MSTPHASLVSELAAFLTDFHAHFCQDANQRVFKGIDERLGALPDPSLQYSVDAAANARRLRSALPSARDAVAANGQLDFDTNLDLDLADWVLGAEIELHTREFNGRHRRTQQPDVGDRVGDGLFTMFINDPRPDLERLDDITARIEGIPEFTRATLDRLDTPVRHWLDMDCQKVAAMPDLLSTLQNWAHTQVEGADSARLDHACQRASEALNAYREQLATLPTTETLAVGPERAREIIDGRGVALSVDALHGMARGFLADTQETIEALRGKLANKYQLDPNIETADLHQWLNDKFAVRVPAHGDSDDLSYVLDRYQAERARVLAFIEADDLFPIFDAQDMKIMRTPSFMEPSIPAGAMLQPPAFREGIRTSLIYLTLRPDQLDDHTELGIPSMMIHEGIPGHHLQLATASTHPSIVRRHLEPADLAEGWTTMLEDYMLELGYMGELTDEARFIGKRDISRLAGRVAIDLFFMTGDKDHLDIGVECDTSAPDPFDAAIALLRAVTGFSPQRARAEVSWYSQERGYPLCYLTGNQLVWELKNEVVAAQKGRLEGLALDRRFHNTFLQAGNMPVRFLRRVFEHDGLLSRTASES